MRRVDAIAMATTLPAVRSLAICQRPFQGEVGVSIMRALLPPEVSCGEPGARAVRSPTERSGRVVARTLAARIVGILRLLHVDQEACPQSLQVVTCIYYM